MRLKKGNGVFEFYNMELQGNKLNFYGKNSIVPICSIEVTDSFVRTWLDDIHIQLLVKGYIDIESEIIAKL